jgi:hypothetical protein
MRVQVAYMAQCTEPAASNGHAITSRQTRSRRGAARGRVAAACCRHAAALSRVQQAGLIHVLQQGGGVCLVNVETLAFRGRPARRFKPRSGSEGTADRGALLRCTCTPPCSPSSRPPHCKSLPSRPPGGWRLASPPAALLRLRLGVVVRARPHPPLRRERGHGAGWVTYNTVTHQKPAPQLEAGPHGVPLGSCCNGLRPPVSGPAQLGCHSSPESAAPPAGRKV